MSTAAYNEAQLGRYQGLLGKYKDNMCGSLEDFHQSPYSLQLFCTKSVYVLKPSPITGRTNADGGLPSRYTASLVLQLTPPPQGQGVKLSEQGVLKKFTAIKIVNYFLTCIRCCGFITTVNSDINYHPFQKRFHFAAPLVETLPIYTMKLL